MVPADLRFSRSPAASQPACLVLVANQNSYMEPRCPTVWTLGADIIIWVRATGQESSLDVVMRHRGQDRDGAHACIR